MFPRNARPSLASCPGRTVEGMDNRDEVRDFLTSRRDRLTPAQAGVPLSGGRRRGKGLRREEVAMLAGMSTDYYTRLERGNLSGVSDSVLGALARALQLNEAEGTHLFDLRHPAVGELELTGEALTLPADHGLTIITYTAEPRSASEQALNFLASWSTRASPATPRESETTEETK